MSSAAWNFRRTAPRWASHWHDQTRPAEAYSLRFSDGELTRWTFSEIGGLDPASFVAPTRIQFKSFDERRVPAYLYKPRVATAAGEKLPVLISIHGGPESQYRPIFSAATQFYVNELGIAVLHPNARVGGVRQDVLAARQRREA